MMSSAAAGSFYQRAHSNPEPLPPPIFFSNSTDQNEWNSLIKTAYIGKGVEDRIIYCLQDNKARAEDMAGILSRVFQNDFPLYRYDYKGKIFSEYVGFELTDEQLKALPNEVRPMSPLLEISSNPAPLNKDLLRLSHALKVDFERFQVYGAAKPIFSAKRAKYNKAGNLQSEKAFVKKIAGMLRVAALSFEAKHIKNLEDLQKDSIRPAHINAFNDPDLYSNMTKIINKLEDERFDNPVLLIDSFSSVIKGACSFSHKRRQAFTKTLIMARKVFGQISKNLTTQSI